MMMMRNGIVVAVSVGAVVCALFVDPVNGFSNTLFQETPTAQLTFPSRTPDKVEIELPDFDELFTRIQNVSPLAKVAMMEQQQGIVNGGGHYQSSSNDSEKKGFDAINPSCKLYRLVAVFRSGHVCTFLRKKAG